MTRVTVSEVRNILGNTSLTDDAVTSFIEMANFIIDDKIVNSGYSENKLKLIELNLSAHFCSIQNNPIKKNKIGDAEQEYKTSNLEGLESTLFGQTVLILDDADFIFSGDNKIVTIKVY